MTVNRIVVPCASKIARWAAGACLAASAFALSAPSAEAHWRHAHHHGRVHVAHHHFHLHVARHWSRRAVASSEPNFSAIVVDANTGHEIYGVNENALRHPASITKVMTLYLLFEQLDKGTLTMQSRIPISEHAAAQEPSKLGIAAGDDISVEDAIKAIVTRSANDVAVAIAEAIGHDEDTFAAMMTRKAHALGMSRTLYRNASGLPNDEQLTTARDLTVLARAMEERFPKYFRYFSTHEFVYDGEVIGNHNHLLGRIEGVDGIKTGYTRASGFNLLTSVHRDGRSLVAVVMGGRTSASRDRTMEQMISDHIAEASTNGHIANMVADDEPPGNPAAPVHVAPPRPAAVALADIPAPPVHHVVEVDGEGDDGADDDEDSAPRAVAPAKPARVEPIAVTRRAPAATPESLGWVKGPDGVSVDGNKPGKAEVAKARAAEARVVKPVAAPASREHETQIARADAAQAADKGAWAIQIGASDDAEKASALLNRARAHGPGMLRSAKAITEKFKKGEDVFYRARFAGLDSTTAEQACRSLKRDGFACFTAHD
jgi:D-alanyl-D-alanine carboxypeptidase